MRYVLMISFALAISLVATVFSADVERFIYVLMQVHTTPIITIAMVFWVLMLIGGTAMKFRFLVNSTRTWSECNIESMAISALFNIAQIYTLYLILNHKGVAHGWDVFIVKEHGYWLFAIFGVIQVLMWLLAICKRRER